MAEASPAQFKQSGYTVIRQAVSPASAQLMTTYALLQQQAAGYYQPEDVFRAAQGRYADAMSETLLLELKPAMERATGLNLLPCYSYLRIYGPGAVLPKHLDRPSCEISASLALGFHAPSLWPLCVHAGGEDKPIGLAPGDMLVYRGADVPHWRDPFAGEWSVHVFLHYVDARGEYIDFKFDGRECIGPFDKATMQRRFLREASYARGDALVAVPPDAPCPCNSGKSFKDCHGAKA